MLTVWLVRILGCLVESLCARLRWIVGHWNCRWGHGQAVLIATLFLLHDVPDIPGSTLRHHRNDRLLRRLIAIDGRLSYYDRASRICRENGSKLMKWPYRSYFRYFAMPKITGIDRRSPNVLAYRVPLGGVGFDINCGVRLVRTNLSYEDVLPVKEKLTQSLFDHIPVGVGSKGVIPITAADLNDALVSRKTNYFTKFMYLGPEIGSWKVRWALRSNEIPAYVA